MSTAWAAAEAPEGTLKTSFADARRLMSGGAPPLSCTPAEEALSRHIRQRHAEMVVVAARALQAAGPVRTVNDMEEIYTLVLSHSQSGMQPWRDPSGGFVNQSIQHELWQRPMPLSEPYSHCPGGGHSVTSPGTIQVSALSPPF